MKKTILGLISILFIGQLAWAQPVSDMAVIPMGITVQSVMRLTITKGGNIEFIFNSASDIANGVPTAFGTAYETTGTISASQNWDLNLAVDEANFIGENSSNTLNLNVVELNVSVAPPNTDPIATAGTATELGQSLPDILSTSATSDNFGSNLQFAIQWRCGVTHKIPGATVAQRYSANIILTLAAHN